MVIEKVLVSYKNCHPELYDQNTINSILTELEKYLKIDPKTMIQHRKRKLKKIIEWLGLKLGLYSCL